MADPKKPSASDFFDGDVDLAEFARGMARLPELGTMMRLAGLGDAQRLSAVKMTSSRLDAIRAQTLGTDLARTRAAHSKAHATQLATKLKQEEEGAKPEVGLLGLLGSLPSQFEIYGKVLDARGQPVPNATVEVSGKETGVMFSAKTDKNGIYRLGLPVGEKSTETNEGEELLENVTLEGTVLQTGLMGVVKAGEMARRVLSVPLSQTLADLAAPILRGRTSEAAQDKPNPSAEQDGKADKGPPPAKPSAPKPTATPSSKPVEKAPGKTTDKPKVKSPKAAAKPQTTQSAAAKKSATSATPAATPQPKSSGKKPVAKATERAAATSKTKAKPKAPAKKPATRRKPATK